MSHSGRCYAGLQPLKGRSVDARNPAGEGHRSKVGYHVDAATDHARSRPRSRRRPHAPSDRVAAAWQSVGLPLGAVGGYSPSERHVW